MGNTERLGAHRTAPSPVGRKPKKASRKDAELRQRRFELHQALEAVGLLIERLELADEPSAVLVAQVVRVRLLRRLAELDA